MAQHRYFQKPRRRKLRTQLHRWTACFKRKRKQFAEKNPGETSVASGRNIGGEATGEDRISRSTKPIPHQRKIANNRKGIGEKQKEGLKITPENATNSRYQDSHGSRRPET